MKCVRLIHGLMIIMHYKLQLIISKNDHMDNYDVASYTLIIAEKSTLSLYPA